MLPLQPYTSSIQFTIVHYAMLNAKSHTHHCSLYESTGFSSLSLRRWTHWHIFIYKGIGQIVIIGKLPSYLSDLLSQMHSSYSLRSNYFILLDTPRTRTELLVMWLPGAGISFKKILSYLFQFLLTI